MNYKEQVKYLNDLALEYINLQNSNENGRKLSIRNNIITNLCDEHSSISGIVQKGIEKNHLENYVSYIDIITDFLMLGDVLNKFIDNAQRFNNNFSKFFLGCMNNKIGTYYKKYRKDILQKLSLDGAYQDSNGNYQPLSVADIDAENILNAIDEDKTDTMLQEMSYTIIHFLEHKGKDRNPIRHTYYKMFFTDSIVTFIKGTSDNSLICGKISKDELKRISQLNQQQLFSALETNLLDMFMKDECRTVTQIYDSKLKTYNEINLKSKKQHSNDIEIILPIENEVFLHYIENYLDLEAPTHSAISQQRGNFRKFMEKITDKYF